MCSEKLSAVRTLKCVHRIDISCDDRRDGDLTVVLSRDRFAGSTRVQCFFHGYSTGASLQFCLSRLSSFASADAPEANEEGGSAQASLHRNILRT